VPDGKCNNCGTPTQRKWGLWDVLSCSERCDTILDDALEMASAHIAPEKVEGGRLFTPRLEDGARLQMLISDEDYDRFRAVWPRHKDGKGRYVGQIVNLVTGMHYEAYTAACEWSRPDGGCWCDALVKPVEDNA
jgi:hypothetical protein